MARSSASPARPAADSVGGRSLAMHLLRSLRPRQWTKNVFVFAGLVFSGKLRDPAAVTSAALAFVVFCVLSGVVYLINDVRDQEADRRHPAKSQRPIASGAVTSGQALAFAGVLSVIALAAALWISVPFAALAALYVALLSVYSLWLKHVVILDALTLAMGFVIRAWAGAVAIPVPMSHWLLLLMLLGALFLALSKRRAELVQLADDARHHRRILAEYSPYLLDQMISVVTASTLLAYILYTIDDRTVAKFGGEQLVWTVPFPLYGIFRYLYLVHQREGGGNPSEILVTDKPLLVCVALWGLAVIALIYWRGSSGALFQ
jgi:4-hydroxybenzoate polyprenyltransferase